MYALKSANDEALLGLIEDHDEPVLGKCTTWVNERRAKPWIRPSVRWKFNGRGTESAFKCIAPILIAQLYWQTQIVITVLLNKLTKRPRETFFAFQNTWMTSQWPSTNPTTLALLLGKIFQSLSPSFHFFLSLIPLSLSLCISFFISISLVWRLQNVWFILKLKNLYIFSFHFDENPYFSNSVLTKV